MNERELAFRKTLADLESKVQRFALPIYGVRGTVGKPIGSGFLLGIAGHTLLVTAAHVVDERHVCTLQIPGATRIVPFGGTVYSTGPREKVRDPDYGLDIALFDLDLSAMLEQPATPVLAVSDLDPSDLPARQTAYGFVGFPGSENEALPGHRFQIASTYYGGEPANQSKYDILGYDPRTHFIMMFEKQRMIDPDGREVEVPEPFGMSGGPVWRLGTFPEIDNATAEPKVIAVTVEWAPKANCLVGVRMSLVLEAMRQLMPALKEHIPEAAHVQAAVKLDGN